MYFAGVKKPPCGCPGKQTLRGLGASFDLNPMNTAAKRALVYGAGGGSTGSLAAPSGMGAGQEFLGTACPGGMVATGSATRDISGNYSIRCAPALAPAPVAAPAPPPITITNAPVTTVSPNIQTQITPQISPVFQQSSGSGAQTAGTSQSVPGGQSGAGGGGPGSASSGSGISAQDLQNILAQQERDRAAADAAREASAAAAQRAMLDNLTAQNAAAQKQLVDQLNSSVSRGTTQVPVYVPTGGGTIVADAPAAAPVPVADQSRKSIKVVVIGGVVLLVLGGAIYFTHKKQTKKRGAK